MNKTTAMSPSNPEIVELFNMLESNRPQDVANIKSKFSEMFVNMKDAWLVIGLIDYYQSTESMRSVDILTKVPVPHDKYLFDKLGEGLKGNWRSGALGLLGHVVRKQPLWLHKITKHPLFRELLNLLKNEKEVVPLMSGLLVLITLLPMIPTLISPFFQEIFEVFARVAAWESHRGAEVADGHREHLRLGLYCLFHNLYAMYPCNFFDFLKREYGKRENAEIFTHTVRPMLEAVRVHPLLITASKNSETEIARWKKMEHHDVLVECRRFSSEGSRRQRDVPDDGRFRSRCGTDVASLLEPSASPFQTSKSSNSTPNLTETRAPPGLASDVSSDPDTVASISKNCEKLQPGNGGWFSLLEACDASAALSAPQTPLPLAANSSQDAPSSHTPISQIPLVPKQQDGGSPPEAAIEATPENTPIKDVRQRFVFPNNSPAVRALGSRLSQPHPQSQQPSTAPLSQPPSPLKKESSPFGRGGLNEGGPTTESQDAFHAQNRINRFLSDRTQQTGENFSSSALSPRKRGTGSPLKKISPKEISSVPSVPDSPVPLGAAAPVSGSTDWPLAKPKPRKDGVAFDTAILTSDALNREDREVTEISKRGEVMRSSSTGRDAEVDGRPRGVTRQQGETEGIEGEERWADDEVLCEGNGVDCSERRHGLHMPQSSSMLEFARHIAGFGFPGRSRNGADAGSGNADGRVTVFGEMEIFVRRRTRSCPETDMCRRRERPAKTRPSLIKSIRAAAMVVSPAAGRTEGTQTVDAWPPSYGLLFADALRNFGERNLAGDCDEGTPAFSPYEQVDRYVEILANSGPPGSGTRPEDEVDRLRQQLRLLQLELLYERHRREVHAYRNRRLLGRARSNRATAEENAALKRQTALLRAEAEDLRQQIARQRQISLTSETKQQENDKYWQRQLASRDAETAAEREEKERLAALLLEREGVNGDASPETQRLHAALFDVTQRLHRATRKSETGDRLADCVKRMRRELVLCGEREATLREALSAVPAGADAFASRLARQCREQLAAAQTALQAQNCKTEYLQARENELETAIAESEASAQELKRQLRFVNEEYGERLKAAEDKYQTIKRVNQRLEAHCLELLQRAPRSPQTASGFSPQSSPLSASLASSEGHGPLLGSRVDEIRNLQVIVDAHDAAESSGTQVEDGV